MLDPVRFKARVIGLTAATFLGGVAIASGLEWTAGTQATTIPVLSGPDAQEVRAVSNLSEAFVSISDAVAPAVVNIDVERPRRAGAPSPFDIFGLQPPQDQPQRTGGTGFMVSGDGHIITNNHVVEGAERITVILQDRRELPAEIVGRDPNTDIAVIRVEGNGFPTLALGNSEETRVGEWVLAIGNPLRLTHTVTAGIVSAKDRNIQIIEGEWAIEGFIQTDAAINPGNSGGPLVNLRGEVIGVNTAIASRTGLSEGYGFAVPIDLARRVANDLIRHGYFRRPLLGVSTQPVTSEDAEVYDLPAISGARVLDFPETSPARQAGIQIEDVIVAVDGRPVGSTSELQRRIAQHDPGDRVVVEVIRFGERHRIRVQLAEAPTQTAARERPAPEERGEALGIQVTELTAQVARQLGYAEPGGVVVAQTARGSQAAQRGVQQGMRILQVDREEVGSVADFNRIMQAKQPGEVVSLLLDDPRGRRLPVNLRMPR